MNKNYKVIKIYGFRGVLTAIFVIGCAITGFAVFPGWMFMHMWNLLSETLIAMPKMELIHGVILWAIVALSIYGINNNRSLIGFSSAPALNEEQIKDIMNKVKNNAVSMKSVHNDINTKNIQQDLNLINPDSDENNPENNTETKDNYSELRK